MITPDRAAAIFRELLITPPSELVHFSRRQGLVGHPGPVELERARDLLQAMMVALESGPGPNWSRIDEAWRAMVEKHGKPDMQAMGVAPPAWVRAADPAKPSLGDPAPGTAWAGEQQQQRERFVPAGKPRYVPPTPAAQEQSSPPPAYAPPAPPVQSPAAGQRQTAAMPATREPPPPPARTQGETVATSVARYAAFCAACAALPERLQQTLREYGIADEAERADLDDEWQDRFDEDPALHQQWERLCHQFVEQLRKNQR